MSDFSGKTVLVTGGAIGLGKLMAQRSFEEGAKAVILWDINPDTLKETKEEFEAKTWTVHTAIVDVSDPEKIQAEAEKTLKEIGAVDILFNNAGIVIGKHFWEHSSSDIEKAIRINVLGVMHVAHCFLPKMIEQGSGHIINIASAAGMISLPKQTTYCGSKWAVNGWSDALRLELEAFHPGVKVTTVCPSYISTGMFDGVKAPLLTPILTPDDAVNRMIAGVKGDKIMLRMPFMVKLLPLLKGITTMRLFDLIGGRIFGVHKSMDEFKGRS